ncbi:MAG: chain length determinant protein tyrosine kinase EpsG [Nitrosomonas sp.]|nr:chain length determinant protein tyrosine kinase EpsG [Nitrosomonas sp.]MDP1949784.1 chain length determinant protein tyrosine kinase EpsG [Nitrosomonas sp.]
MNAPVYPDTRHPPGSGVVSLSQSTSSRKYSIGRILLEKGKITPEDAERVLRLQKESGMRFGDAAQKLGLITEADIQQVLAHQFDYPYLLPGQGGHPPELVVAYQPFGAQVEIFRAVRSQLMQRWFSAERKALAIVSSNPGDGVSLFTANLAVVFSQLGERTLLVDANLRYPQQQQIFNLKDSQGLSDVLAGRAAISDVISRIESFVDLSVLPAGTLPPNPMELLSRAQFDDLNEYLVSQFDVILYDTSAFSSGADALAIAARTEGVLLVAHKNDTRLADIATLNEQIIRSGAEVVGSVLIDF